MIEETPVDKFIGQLTFSFMQEGEQSWFPWFGDEVIDPKPRKRTKSKKSKKIKKEKKIDE
tara:strand:+ start:1418 stop:1597 length:180 start_codon:yes stop_codon:yes gene_type:complete